MKMPELIIFDFDGTLVDTVHDIAHHANATLKEMGFEVHPVAKVQRAVGRGVHELMKELQPSLMEDAALLDKTVASFKKRYASEPVIHSKAYDGVRETLGGALKHIRKTVLTNKPHALTQMILGKLGLSHFFEDLIGLDFGYPAKPDPAAILHWLRKWQVPASRAILVGDSQIDRQTASNAAIGFAWVRYGYDDLLGTPVVKTYESAWQWAEMGTA